MKLVLVHGDHTAKIQARLDQFVQAARDRDWVTTRIDKDTPASLAELVSADSLFGAQGLLLVDAAKLDSAYLNWHTAHAKRNPKTVVVYKYGTVAAGLLKKLKPDKVEVFTLPKTIFRLMDMLSPGNAHSLVHLVRRDLETEPTEFVFALLAKQVRDMYWAVTSADMTYPAWRVAKLTTQGRRFGAALLAGMVSELATIDYHSKTGKANTRDLLDLFFLKYLQ